MTPLSIVWDFKTDAFTPAERRVLFEGAAARWSSVVLGWPARPDGSPVTLPNSTPLRYLKVSVELAEFKGAMEDAFAMVDTTQLLAKTLGKEEGRAAGLPYEGTIKINRKYVDVGKRVDEPARVKDSIVHELGHILGVGTVFDQKRLAKPLGKSEFVFVGDVAMRAYAQLLGPDPADNERGPQEVPLVPAPGASTPAYHWNEKGFKFEIMSEMLDAETAATRTFEFNAISVVTVGALKDIGYEVDFRNAEPFELQKSHEESASRALV
jgi:hypothetical protein